MIHTLEELGGLAGVAALITALVGVVKNLSESRKVNHQMKETADAARSAAEQLSPNHGSSLADSIRRIESSLIAQREDLTQLRREALMTHDNLANQFEAVDHRLTQLEAMRLAEQLREDAQNQPKRNAE